MSIRPETKLGYTLGLRRDKDPRGGYRRTGEGKFSTGAFPDTVGKISTRMAGERLNIFDLEPGELKAPYVKGSRIRSRFPTVYPEWSKLADETIPGIF